MTDQLKIFGDYAKSLSKSPLGIIGLFIVLVYGMASLATVFSGWMTPTERLPLIYFLVLFPVLVLSVFAWLVNNRTIFAPSDFDDESNFVAVAALAAATAQSPNGRVAHPVDVRGIARAVREAKQEKGRQKDPWQSSVLWVDDEPENNVLVRQAFEALGVTLTIALSTSQALSNLEHNKYAAIISDMGRREGPREGYKLLESLRARGDRTPFFIYSSSSLEEHRREAESRGAQGSTNDPQDLFRMVTSAVIKRAPVAE